MPIIHLLLLHFWALLSRVVKRCRSSVQPCRVASDCLDRRCCLHHHVRCKWFISLWLFHIELSGLQIRKFF
ncbi:hypothetical protein AAZX31_10G101400 [Glycine max]